MTFRECWEQLTRKKPGLENQSANIEITGSNLYVLLEQFYDQGFKEGEKKGRSGDGMRGLFGERIF